MHTANRPSPSPETGANVRWDVTRACDRACPECPLGATRWRDPHELSTIEAMLWMNRLRAKGCRRLAFAGGDPVRRPDLEDLVRHAIRLGIDPEVVLPGGVEPSRDRLEGLRGAGLRAVTVRRCGGRDARARVEALARAVGLRVEDPSCRDAIEVGPTGETGGSIPA